MRDPALVGKLVRIHDLLSGSFVRYLLEAAGVRTGEEWDRKALDAFEAWGAADRASRTRIEEILEAEKTHPLPPLWPLQFSQYHYVSAAYLLAPVVQRMEPILPKLEAEAAGLDAWPEGREAAAKAAEAFRSNLDAVRSLAAARPKVAPVPGTKKGVSASRW